MVPRPLGRSDPITPNKIHLLAGYREAARSPVRIRLPSSRSVTLVRVGCPTAHTDSTCPFRSIERLAPGFLRLFPFLEDLSQKLVIGLILVSLVRAHEIPDLL